VHFSGKQQRTNQATQKTSWQPFASLLSFLWEKIQNFTVKITSWLSPRYYAIKPDPQVNEAINAANYRSPDNNLSRSSRKKAKSAKAKRASKTPMQPLELPPAQPESQTIASGRSTPIVPNTNVTGATTQPSGIILHKLQSSIKISGNAPVAIVEPSPSQPTEGKIRSQSAKRQARKQARQLTKQLAAQQAEHILQDLDCNQHLMEPLQKCLFKAQLNRETVKGATLRLYLPGIAHAEKQELLRKLQTTLNQDSRGFIQIRLGLIETQAKLQEELAKASPLAGKTIWFDEFETLDEPNRSPERSKEEHQRILAFLNTLFAPEEAEPGNTETNTPHDMQRIYGIDPKNAILALSTTNPNLDSIAALQTSPVGQSLYHRINASNTLTLNRYPEELYQIYNHPVEETSQTQA
jgi:hypothetical protein